MLGFNPSTKLKLISREIIFRSIPIYVITVPDRHRQTDNQTDERHTVA